MRIVNQGDARANGPVSVTLYASTDATLDASDTPLTTITRRVRLKPGQGRNLPIAFATPATLPEGNDYLLAKMDGGSLRWRETSLRRQTPLAVKQPFVDLVSEFVYLPRLGDSDQRHRLHSAVDGRACRQHR